MTRRVTDFELFYEMSSLSCDAGVYRLVYLKRGIFEALGLSMIVVWSRSLMTVLNMEKFFKKKINSAVSLLHYASVTCYQFSSGATRLIIAWFSLKLLLMTD